MVGLSMAFDALVPADGPMQPHQVRMQHGTTHGVEIRFELLPVQSDAPMSAWGLRVEG